METSNFAESEQIWYHENPDGCIINRGRMVAFPLHVLLPDKVLYLVKQISQSHLRQDTDKCNHKL